MTGCHAATVPGPDAAPQRDAELADGGGVLDGGSVPSLDASADAGDGGSAWTCPVEVCDPRVGDDGCREGACVLWGSTAACEVGAGALLAGSPCEAVTDCAPGLACFQDRDGSGVCGRICCPGDELACPEGSLCAGSGSLVDGTSAPWGRCLPPRSCSLLRPEATCEAREGCYLLDLDGTTECRIAGTAGAGEPCRIQEDCQAGFFCGGVRSMLRCVRVCRLGGDECPSDEGRCVAQAHSPEGTGFCTADTTTTSLP